MDTRSTTDAIEVLRQRGEDYDATIWETAQRLLEERDYARALTRECAVRLRDGKAHPGPGTGKEFAAILFGTVEWISEDGSP